MDGIGPLISVGIQIREESVTRGGVDTLVVDDGSTDDTARIARENGARVISHRLNRSLVGTEIDVLAEGVSRNDPGRYTGRTGSGRIVAFSANEDPTGRIVRTRIDDATPIVLLGRQV